MPDQHPGHPARERPWQQRPAFLASAVIVTFILIAAITIAITTRDPHTSSHAAPQTPSPTPAVTSAGSAPRPVPHHRSGSICGLPDRGTDLLDTPPAATRWQLVGSMAAPSAPSIGPGAVRGGIHSCFAHSAAGALFAAVNLMADLAAPDAHTLHIIKARTAHGPGFSAAVDLTRSQRNDGMPAGTGGSSIYQVAGFRYLDYTHSRATLEVIVRLTNGSAAGALVSAPMTMAWQDGDWKRVVQHDGTIPEGSSIDPGAAFIHWSGA